MEGGGGSKHKLEEAVAAFVSGGGSAEHPDEGAHSLQELISRLDQAQGPDWAQYKQAKAAEWKGRGNEELAANNAVAAVRWFTVCAALDPANYVYYSNRSAAYANLGLYEEALRDAEQVIALNPSWPRGYSRKGLACFFLKKYDHALQAYTKGLELDPENEAMKASLQQLQTKVQAQDANEKGEEAVAKNKLEHALQWFDKAISLDPTESVFTANRADAYLRVGDGVKALNDADQTIRLRPDWPKSFLSLSLSISFSRFSSPGSLKPFANKQTKKSGIHQKSREFALSAEVR
ncbi:Stress-induced-phosphoprotein 1 [Balamuthia mandrillaris]